MRVWSVTPLDRKRCKVLLEEDFALVLYPGDLSEYGIREGGEVARETLRLLLEEVLPARARERALGLLQSQSRTRRQIEERLTSDGYPPQVRQRVMDFLEEYRLVDDQRFARAYLSLHGSRKSRRQLLFELQQKGVSREDVEAALEEETPDEEAAARAFLRRRRRNSAPLSREEKGRIGAAMARKGFSYDLIRRLLEEWEEEEDFGIN